MTNNNTAINQPSNATANLPAGRLFLVSTLVLFYELSLIRYLGTEIPIVGFFKNLILIATFLGFGVGLQAKLSKTRGFQLFGYTAFIPVVIVMILSRTFLSGVAYLDITDEAVLLGSYSQITGMIVLLITFVIAMIPLIYLGAIVANYFDAFSKPLHAYGWNILGSLAGTLGFTLFSSLSSPPSVWFLVCGLLFMGTVIADREAIGGKKWRLFATLGYLPAILTLSFTLARMMLGYPDIIWTPYYKVELYPMTYTTGEATGHGLTVNNTWFQRSFDTTYLDHPEELDEEAPSARTLRFIAPFVFAQPKSVLVLGSGLGNDTASAIYHGVERIHAIDIDPVIVELSDEYHPNQPYRDESVTVTIDDARHYLSASPEKYDLILFGVLEARSLFSQFSNLRLDNYVYTREAIEAAKEHLSPGGVLWLNMWVPKPWVKDKFDLLMQEVYGESFVVLQGAGSSHYSFVGCDGCSAERFAEIVQTFEQISVVPSVEEGAAAASTPTDDWPHIFFRTRSLPTTYLVLLGGLVLLSIIPIRSTFKRPFKLDWGFFFMGAAFLLIEAGAVVRMALLAGTTWLVNGAVFAAVLVFIFLSNWAVIRWQIKAWRPVFILLVITLLFAYFFPFSTLLTLPNWMAISLGAAILTLPVLFSGIIFSVFFRDAEVPSRALASNLFGAILGGFTEYFSMLTGNRAMSLVALAIYFLALLSFQKSQKK
ncbi:MAG: hypothetical protein OEZ02_01780 [Anaerolineae bacterium]|nr:hypothetical protein [Anaerolineae bacterium]